MCILKNSCINLHFAKENNTLQKLQVDSVWILFTRVIKSVSNDMFGNKCTLKTCGFQKVILTCVHVSAVVTL